MPTGYTIGVGVFVFDPYARKILVGKRGPACRRGAGRLALPGGHVEPGETVTAAAQREVMDETALAVQLADSTDTAFSVPGLLAVTDHLDPDQQRDGDTLPHLSFWLMTRYVGGEPQRLKPDKCEWWQWMTPTEVATWRGVDDPAHPQYYWTPMPLWRRILRPYFGEF